MNPAHSLLRPLLWGVALSSFALTGANADLIYYDAFDAAPGTNPPTGWENSQPVGLSVGVAAGSLTYPNLAVSGNKWELNNFKEANPTITNKFTDTPLASGQTLYFSFLMNVAEANTSGSPSGILRLGSSIGGNDVAAIGFGVSEEDAEGQFRLSLDGQHRGYNHDGSLKIATPFNEGETIFIVGSYTFSGGSVSYWVNPDEASLGDLTAPVAHYTDPGHASRPIDQYEMSFSSNGAIPGSWFLDEFRIGTTWADVTPVPEPSTYALLAGAGVIAFTIIRRRKQS